MHIILFLIAELVIVTSSPIKGIFLIDMYCSRRRTSNCWRYAQSRVVKGSPSMSYNKSSVPYALVVISNQIFMNAILDPTIS